MKKINFKKIVNSRNTYLLLFVLTAIFLFGKPAFADLSETLGNVVGTVIAIFIRAISSILILIVGVLMNVATYSDFINAPAVAKGWVVVRDLCNMFFVVILLIIAFATILGQEEYGAKKMLPKLIMAAVLINFSKLICGLMIDVSNVVMLTFVNAFSSIGAGNILDVLGIADVTKIAVTSDSGAVTFGMIVSSYIFGLIYVVIATVVVAAMLAMLVIRLVMIWILVVLSPLAFFLQAVPGKGASYAGQWWSKWTSNLLVGPIIAFFLWLSFAALQNSSSPLVATDNADLANNNANIASSTSGMATQAGTPAAMAKFVIAIGMLLGGMKIAQEVGGEAGGAMGKVFSKGKGLATAAGIGALAMGGKAVGRGTLKVAGTGANLFSQKITDPTTGKTTRKGNAVGNFALGWQEDLTTSNKKAKKEAAAKYLKKIGIGEKGSEAGQTLIDTKGFQYASNVAKGAAIGAFTGGFGFAASTLGMAGLGAGIGAGVGATGTAARQKIKTDIKDYEGAQGNLSKTKAELDIAKGAKTKIETDRNNKKTADDFERDKARFDELVAKGAGSANRFTKQTTAAEDLEYAKLKGVVNDKKVVADYNKSNKYLTDNKVTDSLSELDQKVLDADTDITNKDTAFKAEEVKFNARDSKKYQSNKDWEKRTNFVDAFQNTKAAMKDNTKKKAAAQEWVKIASNDNQLLNNINKPSEIYSSAGLSETWKKRFEELNNSEPTSVKAIDNMVAEINDDKNPLDDKKMESMAKALAAFRKKDGKIDSATLGRLESALNGKGYAAASYSEKVSTQYKQFGSSIEDVKDGSGSLQYDAFAKNSAKAPVDRNAAKDIMGVSFDKLNDKLPANFKLNPAAGVNQQVGGAQLQELSKAMSDIIDDEIKSLQSVGGDVNNQKISQLNNAKSRLESGSLSGLSLKNTDVSYKGDTDSERRQSEYNTTQHETMHQYGAKNEELVNAGASALQESKLVGRIPQSDSESGGKRYDEVLGKMIANMENSGASQEAMSQAVSAQVAKWQVPNAQRVIETENGERDTVADTIVKTTEQPAIDTEKTISSIDKLTEALDKPLKVTGIGGQDGKIGLDIPTANFFRKMFGDVKESVSKGDESLGEKLKPLSAMAAKEEALNRTAKQA